jgi:hypothetical protein
MRGAITKRPALSAWWRQARAVVNTLKNRPARMLITPPPVSLQRIRVNGHAKAGNLYCRSVGSAEQVTGLTMNALATEKQTQVISAITEGMSIRSASRMFDVHRDTIGRLALTIGEGCERQHDRMMRNLQVNLIEMDEQWQFINKKASPELRPFDRHDESHSRLNSSASRATAATASSAPSRRATNEMFLLMFGYASTPAAMSSAISASENLHTSRITSLVCSPMRGPGRISTCGVRCNLNRGPSISASPITLSSILRK